MNSDDQLSLSRLKGEKIMILIQGKSECSLIICWSKFEEKNAVNSWILISFWGLASDSKLQP